MSVAIVFRNLILRFSSDLVAVYADHSLSPLEGQSVDIPIYLVILFLKSIFYQYKITITTFFFFYKFQQVNEKNSWN